jgi:apolipoprotein N-acyltransferase
MARARTVEQGLPMLRAANTGISAIVDPYGRIVRSLGLGERSVLDGNLPSALQPTLYARLGRTITLLLVLVILISYAAARSFV